VSKRTVKLLYHGPAHQQNLDVAAATGDGRLEPGRAIEVDAELAELLERSTPHWKRSGKAASKGKRKAAAAKREPEAAAEPEPEASSEEQEG
jgi:hypothetical protein